MAWSGTRGRDDGTTCAFLASVAASTAADDVRHEVAEAGTVTATVDPVVLLWKDWAAANRQRTEACHHQQRLEKELLREFGGFPRAKIVLALHIMEDALVFIETGHAAAELCRRDYVLSTNPTGQR